MRLDLHTIINIPGGCIPFEYEPELMELVPGAIVSMTSPKVRGSVRNAAGVLHVEAELETVLSCVCDRCAAVFELPKRQHIEAIAADELQDEENPDMFLLDGDCLDLDEVITTAFLFEMDSKFLCSEDCKGLCPACGKNLNEGPCGCAKAADPRLAVLRQLLEKEE